MRTLLAIETSCELASAALYLNDQLLSREERGVQTHSQTILPMVDSLLREAGLSLAQCTAIAFGCGPGSFTGVRTACGIAQGLAFGAGLPVVPVVTLEAMAQSCMEQTGATEVLAVLDARMHEVYWAQYRFAGQWQAVSAPALSKAVEVRMEGQATLCGNGLTAYAAELASVAANVDIEPHVMPHARAIAQLGRAAWERGVHVHPREAQPLYLRNRIALTTAEREAQAKVRA